MPIFLRTNAKTGAHAPRLPRLRESSLTQGLLHLGTTINGSSIDLVTKEALTDAAPIGSGLGVYGLDPPDDNCAYRSIPNTTEDRPTSNITLQWCFYLPEYPTGADKLFTASYGSNDLNTSIYKGMAVYFGILSGNAIATAFSGNGLGSSSSNRKQRGATSVPIAGQINILTAVFYGGGSSTAPDIYLNGVNVNGTASGTATTIGYETTALAGIVQRDNNTLWQTPEVISFYTAAWSRRLSAEEIGTFALEENRWQLFESDTYRNVFLPATTSPSTSTFFLKTNAKTGAHAPQEVTSIDWQHPMLRHCTSIVVNIGPNPVRFDRDYGNPQQPTVDNSSGDVTTERNSVTGTLSKRFSGDATNDRVSLGSITSDDPWSFFGQTSASVVCHTKHDGFGNSTFPRFVDKSNGGSGANGWSIWWKQSPNALAIAIGGSSSQPEVPWSITNTTNVFGFNVTNVPLSGTATATLEAFSDGASIGTDNQTSMPPFPATTTNAAIGNWNHSSDRMFDGFIDYVAIFDRAIPASQHAMFGNTPFAFMQTSERTYYIPEVVGGSIEHLGQGHFSSSHFAPKHLSSSSAPVIPYKITMII